jgi:hypothetical protein
MSNTLTRKGIALGTAVTFVAALLTGIAPAQAANTGDITLVPKAGESFNSIRQSGIVVKSVINGSAVEALAGNDDKNLSQPSPRYIASGGVNDAGTAWTGYTETPNTTRYLTYELVAAAGSVIPAGLTVTAEVFNGNGTVYNPDHGNATSARSVTVTEVGSGTDARRVYKVELRETTSLFTRTGGAGSYEYQAANFTTTRNIPVNAGGYVELQISAPDATSDLTFALRPFLDAHETAASPDGVIQSYEAAGLAENVTLYADQNVTGTVELAEPVVGQTTLSAEITFTPALNINPYMVSTSANHYAMTNDEVLSVFYKNGAEIPSYTTVKYVVSSGKLITTASGVPTITVGNYSVRSYYSEAGFENWITPLNSYEGIIGGISEAVDGVKATIADTATTRVITANQDYEVKAGITSVAVTAQALDSSLTPTDLKYANLRVRALFRATTLATGSTAAISMGGTSATVSVVNTDTEYLFARTDANGQVPITVTGTAANNDAVRVSLQILQKDGSWTTVAHTAIAWKTAVLSSFATTTPALSGDSVTAQFEVLDQFGGGINVNNATPAKALSVTVVARDGEGGVGELNETLLKQTVSVPANGLVSVTFPNWVPVAGHGRAVAYLQLSEDTWSSAVQVNGSAQTATINLYKNAATGEVTTVENTYSGTVTYDAFSATSMTGQAATMTGTVETTTAVGAAAQAVTISGTGLFFSFDNNGYTHTFTEGVVANSATAVTDVNGRFSVLVYAHKVGTYNVTITSGGKSTTVALTVGHNSQLLAAAGNNKLSLKWPARPGLGVTVAEATFTDKWGNPVSGASVTFTPVANGYVFVDGSAATVTKTTGAAGKATVRVRSFSEGRLQTPGGMTADVTAAAGFTGSTVDAVSWTGFFGVQATANAGAKAGVVNVKAFNAAGRTVRVFIGSREVAKVDATKRVTSIRVKGVKAGDRGLTVRVGKKVVLFKPVLVK